ncbi:aminoglycoside phosphotransferase [Phytoactinopolyspora sp. XMNu-373]|uniref:Aminoglycoside phosphotransferase n=1 Tax=Phytoactinopolyspora mesophila TaxID=2650750 RepID=A0A7K3MA82_9ACTN|nr:aminoglycoside phosphotransferase [Phytoactinopolyspora mesophila]
MLTAARRLNCTIHGTPVYGWHDRTIAAKVTVDSGTFWLRVVSELVSWASGNFWEGNAASSDITSVPKPEVLNMLEWGHRDRRFRAELLTYISPSPVSASQELLAEPDLTDEWWRTFDSALESLAGHPTDRAAYSQLETTRRLRAYFADRVDPAVTYWHTAHADLHWNNLTAPDCVLLDWESWGQAPFGYDIATLYCHSLLVPGVAERIRRGYAEILDSPDGVRSQLLVIARIFDRSILGDYPDLVLPLHRLADQLVGR